MQLEKKTESHKIYKRNDGRFAVKTLKGQPVNGDEKISVLLAEGLITAPEPKAAPEPEVEEATPAEEASAEEASAEEAPAEESPAEEAPAEEAPAEEAPAEEAPAEEAPAEEEKTEDEKGA